MKATLKEIAVAICETEIAYYGKHVELFENLSYWRQLEYLAKAEHFVRAAKLLIERANLRSQKCGICGERFSLEDFSTHIQKHLAFEERS